MEEVSINQARRTKWDKESSWESLKRNAKSSGSKVDVSGTILD